MVVSKTRLQNKTFLPKNFFLFDKDKPARAFSKNTSLRSRLWIKILWWFHKLDFKTRLFWQRTFSYSTKTNQLEQFEKKDVLMEPTMKKKFMMVSQTRLQNKTFLSNNFFLFAKDLWAGAVWKKTSLWSQFWKLVFMLVSLTRLQARTFSVNNIFLFQQFEKDVFLEPTVKNCQVQFHLAEACT
jgi:hypothetical protein